MVNLKRRRIKQLKIVKHAGSKIRCFPLISITVKTMKSGGRRGLVVFALAREVCGSNPALGINFFREKELKFDREFGKNRVVEMDTYSQIYY